MNAPDPDETLAAIDDVLTDWAGSRDAMIWAAPRPDEWADVLRPALARRIARLVGLDEAVVSARLDEVQQTGGDSPHIALFLPLAAELFGGKVRQAVELLERADPESEAYRTSVAHVAQVLAPYVAQVVLAEEAAHA